MEADTLREMIHHCPLRLVMNNGNVFDVEKPEFIMVADYEVTVMVRRDGVRRNVTLALVNVSSAESTKQAS